MLTYTCSPAHMDTHTHITHTHTCGKGRHSFRVRSLGKKYGVGSLPSDLCPPVPADRTPLLILDPQALTGTNDQENSTCLFPPQKTDPDKRERSLTDRDLGQNGKAGEQRGAQGAVSDQVSGQHTQACMPLGDRALAQSPGPPPNSQAREVLPSFCVQISHKGK